MENLQSQGIINTQESVDTQGANKVKNCSNCNKLNRDIAKYCRFCGAELVTVENKPLGYSENYTEKGSSNETVHNQDKEQEVEHSGNIVLNSNLNYVGLNDITDRLNRYIELLKIEKEQKKLGIQLDKSTTVIIFRGETGTGKSLVANQFINDLKKSKVLSANRIEKTTLKILQKSYNDEISISQFLTDNKPGILLVDEIHGDKRYLHELLLGLTRTPCDTVCILLGLKGSLDDYFADYTDDIQRVSSFYDFPNPSDELLSEILEHKIAEIGFKITDEVRENLPLCIQEARHDETCIYKNGWLVEKEILKKIRARQAVRLQKNFDKLKKEDYIKIILEDLPITNKQMSVPEVMAQLDELIGMDNVKAAIKELAHTIQLSKEREAQGLASKLPAIHIVFTGNPGTGKTTVARLLGKLFYSMKLLPSDKVVETDRSGLVGQYVGQTAPLVNNMCDKAVGGILFIDEAYTLAGADGADSYGQEAIDTLLKRMEDDRGKFVVIAAGYENEMDDFIQANPGLKSRFTHFIHIDDYNPTELYKLFLLYSRKDQYEIADSAKNAIYEIIENLWKNKGKDFANGRTIRNLFDETIRRMSSRVALLPDNLRTKSAMSTITEEDLPKPKTKKLSTEEILAQLDSLIGMSEVKTAVRELCQTIKMNKLREEQGIQSKGPSIHIVFTGNPGTGKTTVARILSKLFYSMGLLPSDTLIETDKSGLVGQYVGETPKLVNKLIDKAMGGVLFIDEAYTLMGTNGNKDVYGQEAIDTLLKRMEDDRGKFVVIAAGYSNEMESFIQSNPGLKSRFTHFIHLNDYNPVELFELYSMFASNSQYNISQEAIPVIQACIKDLYDHRGKDFANGRTIRNLFDETTRKLNTRLALLPVELQTRDNLTTITAIDVPFEVKHKDSMEDVLKQLDELIGMKEVKQAVRELCQTIQMNKEREAQGLSVKTPSIHIVFTGNPGTGKTTVARILGKLFNVIGLLPTDTVVETDRSGLVGQYVGQTAPLVNSMCDKAMGGILFIDEAYTLVSGGANDFGFEAIDTLLKRMEDDRGKFVVIVAGYKNEMNNFIQANPGLKSRFTHFIHLNDYNTDELFQLFNLYAMKENYKISENASKEIYSAINDIWENRGRDFANGRTIRNLFDKVTRRMNSRIAMLSSAERTPEVLTTITEKDVLENVLGEDN